MAAAGCCGSRTWTGRASVPAPPTRCSARSRHWDSSGTARWCTSRSVPRPMHAALEQLRGQGGCIPAAARAGSWPGGAGSRHRGRLSRHLPRAERARHRPGHSAFRVRDERVQSLQDGLCGELRWPLRELGDPVVQRRDGLVAYQLAVVVDDAAAGVTDVVRGADLLRAPPGSASCRRHWRCRCCAICTCRWSRPRTAASCPRPPPRSPWTARAGAWLHWRCRCCARIRRQHCCGPAPAEIWQWAQRRLERQRLAWPAGTAPARHLIQD